MAEVEFRAITLFKLYSKNREMCLIGNRKCFLGAAVRIAHQNVYCLIFLWLGRDSFWETRNLFIQYITKLY